MTTTKHTQPEDDGHAKTWWGHPREGRKRALLGTAVGLGLGLLLAGWAKVDGNADLRLAHEGYEQELDAEAKTRADLNFELTEVQRRLTTQTAHSQLQQARILLARAMLEIDEDNFGQTHDRITEAVVLLRNLDAAEAGIDPAVLTSVTKDLQKVYIRVSADVGSQRVALIAQSDRIDLLLETP